MLVVDRDKKVCLLNLWHTFKGKNDNVLRCKFLINSQDEPVKPVLPIDHPGRTILVRQK